MNTDAQEKVYSLIGHNEEILLVLFQKKSTKVGLFQGLGGNDWAYILVAT